MGQAGLVTRQEDAAMPTNYAAKLPDEVQTMSDIQKKIEEYYARSAPSGG